MPMGVTRQIVSEWKKLYEQGDARSTAAGVVAGPVSRRRSDPTTGSADPSVSSPTSAPTS